MSDKKGAGIPEWVKAGFFKLGNHFAVKFLTKLLARIGLGLSGPIGWIASFFIDKLLKRVWALVVKTVIRKQEQKETAKELKEYDDKISKPGATAEEIKDAGKDFLTS